MKNFQIRRGDMSREQAIQLCSLWAEVWPTEDATPLAEKADDFLKDTMPEKRMVAGSEFFHILEDKERILAVVLSFVREIRFEQDGRLVPVLALAGVCTSPKLQGRGMGSLLVKDAFTRLNPELRWSLFQTGVPGFYEKLGGSRVSNEFRNSFGSDPEANPWWDPYVMVHGDVSNWPEGRVDLCGVAY